jgi:hypothetical protein
MVHGGMVLVMNIEIVEDLKVGEAYGVARKKGERLTLMNGVRGWMVMTKVF